MPYIEARDGTRLFVKEWGSGTPVVLVHGWPLNADSWDDVAVGLAEQGFRAIAYDRRGFGRSDQPPTGYDYDTFADDLAAVIDGTADGQRVAIIGFSMGGGEIARYLGKHGSAKISHAGLIASVVPYILRDDDNTDGVPQAEFDTLRNQIVEDRFAWLQAFSKIFYGVGVFSKPVSQGVLDATFNMGAMAGLGPTLGCLHAFSRTDFRPDLRAFDVPTLIIHGTADQNVPIDPTGRAVKAAVPGSILIEYDGAPHGLGATHKAELIRDIGGFLRGELDGGRAHPQTIRAEPEPTRI